MLDLQQGAIIEENMKIPQPHLQEVLFVMGGCSLDDSHDDDDNEEEERMSATPPRNCAFYNKRTSENIRL